MMMMLGCFVFPFAEMKSSSDIMRISREKLCKL
jgi:hypothetical protein